MSIDKILGGKSTGRGIGTARAKEGKGRKDRVEFSFLLQGVSKTKGSDSAQTPESARKVAALKAQVACGTYRSDLEKVAEKLLKAIAEEK